MFGFSVRFAYGFYVFLVPEIERVLGRFVHQFVTATICEQDNVTSSEEALDAVLFRRLAFSAFGNRAGLRRVFAIRNDVGYVGSVLVLKERGLLGAYGFFLPAYGYVCVVCGTDKDNFPAYGRPIGGHFQVPYFLGNFVELLARSAVVRMFVFGAYGICALTCWVFFDAVGNVINYDRLLFKDLFSFQDFFLYIYLHFNALHIHDLVVFVNCVVRRVIRAFYYIFREGLNVDEDERDSVVGHLFKLYIYLLDIRCFIFIFVRCLSVSLLLVVIRRSLYGEQHRLLYRLYLRRLNLRNLVFFVARSGKVYVGAGDHTGLDGSVTDLRTLLRIEGCQAYLRRLLGLYRVVPATWHFRAYCGIYLSAVATL